MIETESGMRSFGYTSLGIFVEDVIKDPKKPIVRMIDSDGELSGIFSLETLEVVEDFDLDDCDLLIFEEAMRLNRNNFIDGWNDIAKYEGVRK